VTDRALPSNIPKRGLSVDEAAEYCGVSRNTLAQHGPSPTKIGSRSVYDRRALDRWIDGLAGIGSDQPEEDPEQTLLRAIHARKIALCHSQS
jgi:predicted DNA-binding transcriptional regulator AlpA